jgi:cholesterol oxidase
LKTSRVERTIPLLRGAPRRARDPIANGRLRMTQQRDHALTRRNVVQGAVAGAVAAGVSTISSQEAAAQEVYDAVVVGTGFGGAVAALALHAQRKKTLVIERGTFWVTPETLGSPSAAAAPPLAKWAADKGMRVQYWPRPDHNLGLVDLLENRYHRGNPFGLHHYSIFRHAHVLTASGVGGGSLIYSNVNLRAKDAVLNRIGLNGIDYDRAELFMNKFRGKFSKIVTKIPLPPGVSPEQLGPDKDYLLLDRSRALRDAATSVASQLGIQIPWAPLNLSVVEYDHAAGSEADANRTFCERQGRCFLGCLPQARHTLNKTLYKFIFSKDTSLTLSPESEVLTIRRTGDAYEVTYLDRRGERGFDGRRATVRTRQVFLAAGVLGTTEILLRSRDAGGLQLSDKVGHGFSTNGDFGALAVGTKRANGAKMAVYPTRGPINTADLRFELDGKHFTVEDCGIPSMFARVVRVGIDDRKELLRLADPVAFVAGTTSTVVGQVRDTTREFFHGAKPRDPTKDRNSTEAELIDDVFFFNVMGEDDASGRLSLRGESIDLEWDQPIGEHPVFAKAEDILRRLSEAMGGQYTPLPTWDGLPFVFDEKTVIVTHPLGGCRIAPSMADGVVNEFGQVYDGSRRASDPGAVLPGLYIVDGSTIPGALAANPTLTIAAQAIKAVEKALGPLPL